MNEFARVILGKALQLIIQLEENEPAGATLERMSNQVSKEITVFDAFTDLNSTAIRKVRNHSSGLVHSLPSTVTLSGMFEGTPMWPGRLSNLNSTAIPNV